MCFALTFSVKYCTRMNTCVLTYDCYWNLLQPEIVNCGSFFKNLRLVCTTFRDILLKTIPNGDIEFCNMMNSCINVVIKDTKHNSDPFYYCIDGLSLTTDPLVISFDGWSIPIKMFESRDMFIKIFQEYLLTNPALLYHIDKRTADLFDLISKYYKGKPFTFEELGVNDRKQKKLIAKYPISGRGSIVCDHSFLEFNDLSENLSVNGIVLLKRKALSIEDVRNNMSIMWDANNIISTSELISYSDFFEGGILKEEFKNHPKLKIAQPWMFIQNYNFPYLDYDTKKMIIDDNMRYLTSVYNGGVTITITDIHPNFLLDDVFINPEIFRFLSLVSLYKGKKIQDVIDFAKIIGGDYCLDLVALLQVASYNWKELEAVKEKVMIQRNITSPYILRNLLLDCIEANFGGS